MSGWVPATAPRQKPPQNRVDYVDIPVYDMSAAVQESEAVGNDYFDDAVFIGNSLIVGFQRMVPLNARYFASIGLNVSMTSSDSFFLIKPLFTCTQTSCLPIALIKSAATTDESTSPLNAKSTFLS